MTEEDFIQTVQRLHTPKQVIVVRKDLNMRKGKIAAQVAHASLGAILKLASRDYVEGEGHGLRIPLYIDVNRWFTERFTKVCVSCDSENELIKLKEKADEFGLMNCLITDAGFTEFHGVPTLTTLAIGPHPACEVDMVTKHLKLL